MPPISSKNRPLSAVGADLGLQGQTPMQDEETEEERKKRLAAASKQQQTSSAMGQSQVWADLGLGQM